jgi:protoporphyrinogen oxidase
MRKVPVLIAGAGIAGLAAARTLSQGGVPYLLLEREGEAGGFCRSVSKGGYRFDYTGHFLHFKNPALRDWVCSLPGLRLKERRRHAAVYSNGVFTEYPYQENNAGLPTDVVKSNVMDYLLAALGERRAGPKSQPPRTFNDLCLRTFGESITRRFMAPYNAKLLKTPMEKLSPSWMGRFIPKPRVKEVVEGAFHRRPSSAGYNASFFYPQGEGIEALPQALLRGIEPPSLGLSLVSVDPAKHRAVLSDGSCVTYDHLFSSLPLSLLARGTKGLPFSLSRMALRLKATSVYNLNFGLSHAAPAPYSWVYFPESTFIFHRAGFLSACVPESAPRRGSSLYVEVSYRGRRPDAPSLGRTVLASLKKIGWVRNERNVKVRVDLDLPNAYVLYDEAREKAVPALRNYYDRQGVQTIGRWGRWEYGGMESALEQGREAAQRLI